jgi:nucleoside-diphosphate-sugar epimerase
MARILITGASGFVGGHLVAKALENGHEVTAAVRPTSNLDRLKDERIQFLDLPLGDQDGMTTQLQKPGRFDWIIHNAGVTKTLSSTGYQEGNTENTRRLTLALRNTGLIPDKFLFVSSLAALGAAPAGKPQIQANQAPNPLSPYGESKYQTELLLESIKPDFPWVVVQPTAVYGPWERDILTFIKLANKGLELSIGRQSQRLSFIHVFDVAGAIFRVLETEKSIHHRKFILSDGNAYRTEDLGKAVREALGGKKTIKIRLPLGLVKQVAGFAETIGRLQNKASVLNREKIPELAAENWHCDSTPLFEELNFNPAFDLSRGIHQTVEWYRQAGWL